MQLKLKLKICCASSFLQTVARKKKAVQRFWSASTASFFFLTLYTFFLLRCCCSVARSRHDVFWMRTFVPLRCCWYRSNAGLPTNGIMMIFHIVCHPETQTAQIQCGHAMAYIHYTAYILILWYTSNWIYNIHALAEWRGFCSVVHGAAAMLACCRYA